MTGESGWEVLMGAQCALKARPEAPVMATSQSQFSKAAGNPHFFPGAAVSLPRGRSAVACVSSSPWVRRGPPGQGQPCSS